ncbi:MAG: O-antigen ligase family protein [Candidatus Omnitrophica bacterium]|nr:O-antigen ligase family protein [Candidatus Omnitrophota bacterium]
MKQKIIYFLKNTLLINIAIFIILAPFSKKAVKISLLIALVLWILITIAEFGSNFYRHLIVKTPINKQLMFFAFALLLSTVFSVDPYYSHAVLLERYLGYILFFFLGSYLVKSKRNLSVLIGAVILAGFVMGVGGMWDYFHLKPVRLYTAFGKTISNARFMVLQIPLCFIILLYSKNKFLKSGAIISILFLIPCLILNAARAAWVAVTSVLLIVSFFKNRKCAAYLLICVIIIGLFLPQQLKHRAVTTVNPMTWGERLPLWKMSLDIFADFPVFGAGLGMQERLFVRYWKQLPFPLHFQFHDVHNNYLQIMSESGIIGLIAFVWIFIAFFKHVFTILKEISGHRQVILMGLTGSVIAALIFAMSASNITAGVQEAAVFWFIFGMASGLIALKENQENIA